MSETYEESFAGSYNSVEDLSKSVTRFRLRPSRPSPPPKSVLSIQADGLKLKSVISCVVNKFELHSIVRIFNFLHEIKADSKYVGRNAN